MTPPQRTNPDNHHPQPTKPGKIPNHLMTQVTHLRLNISMRARVTRPHKGCQYGDVSLVSLTKNEQPPMEQPTLFGPSKKQPTKKPDQWLIDALKTKTGGFRTTHWQRCPTCKAITLTGINADQCAWTITVDPTPLTPHDELLCTLTNRPTASATPKGKNYELHHRDEDMIASHPPGTGTYGLVFPAHRCGARFPGQHNPSPTQAWNPTPNF